MARVCDLCGKSAQKGNLVARGIANRTSRRTLRHQVPNIRTVRMALEEGGSRVALKLCTSCLKRMKKDKRDLELAATEVATA